MLVVVSRSVLATFSPSTTMPGSAASAAGPLVAAGAAALSVAFFTLRLAGAVSTTIGGNSTAFADWDVSAGVALPAGALVCAWAAGPRNKRIKAEETAEKELRISCTLERRSKRTGTTNHFGHQTQSIRRLQRDSILFW